MSAIRVGGSDWSRQLKQPGFAVLLQMSAFAKYAMGPALGLPYAAIALDGPTGVSVAASTGQAAEDLVRIPLHHQGEAVGELLLASRAPGERFSAADRRLIDGLARAG